MVEVKDLKGTEAPAVLDAEYDDVLGDLDEPEGVGEGEAQGTGENEPQEAVVESGEPVLEFPEEAEPEEVESPLERLGHPRMMDEANSPYVYVELPGGARLPNDPKLRLWRRLVLHEVRGEELDILNNDEIPHRDRMNMIFPSVIKEWFCDETGQAIRKKDTIAKLFRFVLSADRFWLWIQLRRATLGDPYSFSIPCTQDQCEGYGRKGYDLRLMKYRAMDEQDAKAVSLKDRLPSGKVMEWQPLRVHLEPRLLEDVDPKSRKTHALAVRLIKVDDRPMPWGNPATIQYLKRMAGADLLAMEEIFKTREPNIDLGVKMQCAKPSCRNRWDDSVPIFDRDFFRQARQVSSMI